MPRYEAKNKATEQMQGDNREGWFRERERGGGRSGRGKGKERREEGEIVGGKEG